MGVHELQKKLPFFGVFSFIEFRTKNLSCHFFNQFFYYIEPWFGQFPIGGTHLTNLLEITFLLEILSHQILVAYFLRQFHRVNNSTVFSKAIESNVT